MSVRMELSRILICEMHDLQIIELTEQGGERTFPILIGLAEAEAIRRRFQGMEIKRPLTHELLANVIEAFGGVLERVEVCDLREHTFFAELHIASATGEELVIDSRPSDAIALCVERDVPIFVADHVLEQAQSEQ
ncbi:MAG: bifunctional nuclease family protein [Planctomycetota bacterium]